MSIKQAIALMMHGMNVQYPFVAGVFGGMGGTGGTINVLQKDMNSALVRWRETGKTDELKRVAATMQLMGNLTDDIYEKIMKALDGDS